MAEAAEKDSKQANEKTRRAEASLTASNPHETTCGLAKPT